MIPTPIYQFISIDAPALLTAVAASVACGLLGSFLVLRRVSLMGDAISHAVLPGLVLAFLLTGTRAPLPMFLGAAAAAGLSVFLIELVRRLGRMESGAAMGVVFSVFFALGVLLIERAAARQVDLDPDCVLNGMLETIFWLPPQRWEELLTWSALADLPRQLWVAGGMAALTCLFIAAFFKELRLSSFDPGLSSALGFRAGALNAALMAFVAAATVASFEAVGSILVIAMLICPAATARLLTDRLSMHVALSGIIAALSAAAGYLLAAFGPRLLGSEHAVSAPGMIAVVCGASLAIAVLAAPRHGVIARLLRRADLAATIAREDALGWLYRRHEAGESAVTQQALRAALGHARPARRGLRSAIAQGEIAPLADDRLALTDRGRERAAQLIRAHRLWESYLVDQAGLRPDHVHDTATLLEHARDPRGPRLMPDGTGRLVDPHDQPIPPDLAATGIQRP
ncbi:MAG: metal ABC transporter permease [Planctomycetota bacterium]|nr:metal ABC transporter permease [Planctomycetota bacterium]